MFDDGFPFDIAVTGSDYDQFGDSFYVAVPVRREPGAQVFWINDDWFQSHGVPVADAVARDTVHKWLLREFAIQTCSNADSSSLVAKADRYGGEGGTAHGGSGRCVYRGRFNVKGVGPTPLVPDGLGSHADGAYHLIEALRGVIYSELCHAETLNGAVRTIAIIALPPFDVPAAERRCLIVRPNFIRPAHFERSLSFGTAGFAESDQFRDNLRAHVVRDHIRSSESGALDIVARLAEQMGSLDAVRMSQGRFTSSNMVLDGRVADFETFRVFDSWHYTKHATRDVHIFGKELQLLKSSAPRWLSLLRDKRYDVTSISEYIELCHKRGFEETISRVISFSDGRNIREVEKFTQFLYTIFSSNRRFQRVDFESWVVDPDIASNNYVKKVFAETKNLGLGKKETIVLAARLNLWRQTRSDINLTNANLSCEDVIKCCSQDNDIVQNYIAKNISVNRRALDFEDPLMAPVLIFTIGTEMIVYAIDFHDSSINRFVCRPQHRGKLSQPEKLSHLTSLDSIYQNLGRSRTKEIAYEKISLYNKWLFEFTQAS